MIINLLPQRLDGNLAIEKKGETLTFNGEEFDFSAIPDGATLPFDAIDCKYIIGDVDRIDGVLHLTLLAPHGPNASEAARFPERINNPPDGPLELPQ